VEGSGDAGPHPRTHSVPFHELLGLVVTENRFRASARCGYSSSACTMIASVQITIAGPARTPPETTAAPIENPHAPPRKKPSVDVGGPSQRRIHMVADESS
jgi:hypothetical protein